MTHDYKRHGTTTLFAALDVLEGKVIGRCMQRHRHQEFVRFLNAIEAQVWWARSRQNSRRRRSSAPCYPDLELYIEMSGRSSTTKCHLAAGQGSLLNSAQARQISIFTCVALDVFCLAPHRSIKALFVAPTRRARNISHLGGIRETTFRRGQTSTKD
jgi:hypothetical protein